MFIVMRSKNHLSRYLCLYSSVRVKVIRQHNIESRALLLYLTCTTAKQCNASSFVSYGTH